MAWHQTSYFGDERDLAWYKAYAYCSMLMSDRLNGFERSVDFNENGHRTIRGQDSAQMIMMMMMMMMLMMLVVVVVVPS